jgi:methionyl-tRNA formyltransferase
LHGSLLPKYRGAAPINHAIINGESLTGVTTFFLKKNVDTGDIILSDTIQITENMTAGELHDKMKYFGANIVGDTLDLISNNKVNLVKQNDVKSSPAPKIFRENCLIKFDLICEDLHNFIRGLSPYPGAYFIYNSKPLKILKTLKTDRKCLNGELKLIDGKLLLGSLTDALEVLELQPDGKKIMNANDFINGRFIN